MSPSDTVGMFASNFWAPKYGSGFDIYDRVYDWYEQDYRENFRTMTLDGEETDMYGQESEYGYLFERELEPYHAFFYDSI